MLPETRQATMRRIEKNEDFVNHVYTDTTGNLTCCFGRNLSTVKFSLDEGLYLLTNDLERAEATCLKFYPGYSALNEARKSVIVEMAYNLDISSLLGFHDMISATQRGDFKAASEAMLASKWHDQVKGRAERLAVIMEEGNL